MAGRNKNSQVILLDVSPDMHPNLDNISEVLCGHLASKAINSPAHQVGLILYGTTGTDNNVQRELQDSSDYQHIEEAWELKPPGTDEIARARSLPRGTARTDLVDALVVAIDLFKRQPPAAKAANSIVVLSSFMGEPDEPPDTAFLSTVVEQMHEQGITLEVVQVQLGGGKGSTRAPNLATLEHLLVELSNVRFRKARSTPELLSCFRAKEVAPTTKYRGPLTFTPEFSVPVWLYKKTMEVKMPSMKKYSDSMPPSDTSASHEVNVETEFRRQNAAEHEPEVPPEERVKGIPYGNQLVPMQEAVEKYLKFTTEKDFRVIGFVDESQAPRHHFMKDTDVVVPLPENEKAALAMSAVVQAMVRTRQVAIARLVARANANSVSLGVLTPFPGTVQRADCLLFNELPYMEDQRCFKFSSFDNPKVRPSKGQYKAADALMKAMSLDGSGDELLSPEDTVNPSIAYLNQQLAARMAGAELVPGGSEGLKDLLRAPKCMRDAPEALEAARALCPVATADPTSTQGSTLDRPASLGGAGSDSSQHQGLEDGPALKRANSNSNGEMLPKKRKVGTLTPIADFEEMMQHEDTKGAALAGLREVIVTLVNDSIGDRFYRAALDCLAALRSACLKLGSDECNRFNAFMNDVKSRFLSEDAARSDFLAAVANASITLITGSEAPGCSVQESEAEAWLQMRNGGAVGKQADAGANSSAKVADEHSEHDGKTAGAAAMQVDDDEFDDMD